MNRKRIAVIGAGPSGLSAIKSCKEEDVDVVCFEKNGDPGGLWRYHDEDIEGVASVMKTTVINTSKDMGAFSDFPPPKEFPNYMHHSQMYKYFMMYAENFDLLRHIRYFKEVTKVVQSSDYNSTGRWLVTTKDTQTSEVTSEEYDGVMVCVGHHVYPKIPAFPGQKNFKGTIVHTHSLKSCSAFEGQNVAVVGIGNSGVDAAVDAAYGAKQVYLSTRRGCWIFGRCGPNGVPVDMTINIRLKNFWNQFRSFNSICAETENYLNSKFDHATYKLKPKHRVFSAHPTLNDTIPTYILTGRIIVKGDIKRLEEDGILFDGDKEATKVDTLILATGYHIRFPFLNSSLVSTEANVVNLYKYVLPPSLKHPTLALIGVVQPIGPIFPIAEIQCRFFMQLFAGHIKLPERSVMEADIESKNKQNAKRYVNSTRHTIELDVIPFMDELSSQFGAKPNLLKLLLTDPLLYWGCLTYPCMPYQFRIQGPHSWKGARDAILNFKDRMLTPLNENYKDLQSTKKSYFQPVTISLTCALLAVIAHRFGYTPKILPCTLS